MLLKFEFIEIISSPKKIFFKFIWLFVLFESKFILFHIFSIWDFSLISEIGFKMRKLEADLIIFLFEKSK